MKNFFRRRMGFVLFAYGIIVSSLLVSRWTTTIPLVKSGVFFAAIAITVWLAVIGTATCLEE